MQDIRAILFNPSTRKDSKEPKSGPSNPLPATKESEETDDVPSVPLPGRRKKRSMSISSLVRQSKASSETVMIGRKKPGPKKAYAPRGSTLSINEPTGEEDNSRKSSSPHLTLSKITRYKEQARSLWICLFGITLGLLGNVYKCGLDFGNPLYRILRWISA